MKYYCKNKDCNKEISYNTEKYGTGFCGSCAAKNRGHCHNVKICSCNICRTIRGECFGDKNLNYRGDKALYKQKFYCKCGKEIDRRSIRCYSCSNKINSYKNGRTPLVFKLRTLDEYVNWRKEVFKKDNYICQECGIKNGLGITIKFNAHHIKEFNIILDEFLKLYPQFNPIKDKETLVRLAIKYLPFWNVNNGQTLCIKCHDKTKLGNQSKLPRKFKKLPKYQYKGIYVKLEK